MNMNSTLLIALKYWGRVLFSVKLQPGEVEHEKSELKDYKRETILKWWNLIFLRKDIPPSTRLSGTQIQNKFWQIIANIRRIMKSYHTWNWNIVRLLQPSVRQRMCFAKTPGSCFSNVTFLMRKFCKTFTNLHKAVFSISEIVANRCYCSLMQFPESHDIFVCTKSDVHHVLSPCSSVIGL